MLSAILEVILAVLAAVGLMALGWLIFGRWLLPLGGTDAGMWAVLNADGNGEGLEQAVHSLLWLRRCDLWRGRLVIVDRGLDEEGRRLARLLCANTDDIVLCDLEDLPALVGADT